MGKEFLDVETIRDNALLLAKQIHSDGFIPSVIYVGLRGGTTLGNAISEYFKLVAPSSNPPLYAAVVAHSYEGLSSNQHIHIDGWTYNPEFLRKSDRVLLVDDIFDSGLTMNKIAGAILSQGISLENFRIAVHDYKVRSFEEHSHKYKPHYYSRKLVVNSKEEDDWIHYLSHELDGLSDEEMQEHYHPRVHNVIKEILAIRKSNFQS